MSNNWIIEVLGDLRGFAISNDMPALASSLEDAIVVAVSEIQPVATVQSRKEDHASDGRRTGTHS